MAFDPDEYLKSASAFNPDAYLNNQPSQEIPEGYRLSETGDIVAIQPKYTPQSSMFDFGYATPPNSTFMNKLGKAYDASKLAGLAPEVYPVGGAMQIPAGRLASNVGGKVADVANMPINAVRSILKEIAPTTMKGGYEVARSKNPLYTREMNIGKAEGLSKEARNGIANYFKAFFPSANKADVTKATSMSKEAGGVWDVAKKAQEAEQKMTQVGGRYNMSFPQDATLVLPEAVMAARSNAMTANKAREIGQQATWLPNLFTLRDITKNPLRMLGAASPRLNTNLGYLAGKTENAYQTIPRLSDEDLLNLSLLAPRLNNNQGQ
jgi:hypothetical protein